MQRLASLAMLLLLACGGPPPKPDAGVIDAGVRDAGQPDTTPPALNDTVPDDQAVGVSTSLALSLTFSEAIDPSSLVVTTQPPLPLGPPLFGQDDALVVYDPVSLSESTSYTVTVTATDVAGNALPSPTTFTFQTAAPADQTPPRIVATNPAQDAGAVPRINGGLALSLSFDEAVQNVTASVAGGSFDLGPPMLDPTGRLASWLPSEDFTPGASYRITINANDLSRNAMPPYEWRFTMGSIVDVTAPYIVAFIPPDGGVIARNTNLQIVFSEPMRTTVTEQALRINGAPAVGTPRWSGGNTVLDFDPTADWPASAQLTMSFVGGADVAGNTLMLASSSFRTTATTDTQAPTIVRSSPDAMHNVVGRYADCETVPRQRTGFSVTFSEPMNREKTQAAFTVKPTGSTTPLAGTFSWADTTLTFTPSAPLDYGQTYRLTVDGTAADAAQNALAPASVLSFDVRVLRYVSVQLPAIAPSGRLESTDAGIVVRAGTNLGLGELNNKITARAFFTLSLASLPNNLQCITDAQLNLSRVSGSADPYVALGPVIVTPVQALTVTAALWNAPGVAAPTQVPSSAMPSVALTAALRAVWRQQPALRESTRWRLQFSTRDRNNDSSNDNLVFSANTAAAIVGIETP